MEEDECSRLIDRMFGQTSIGEDLQSEIEMFSEYTETNVIDFINNVVSLLRKSKGSQQINLYITVIYSSSLRNKAMRLPENLPIVWEALFSVFEEVIISPLVSNDNQRTLFSLTIGNLIAHIFTQNQEDTSAQESMLSLIEKDISYATYVIESIVEAMLGTYTICGFNLEAILQIIGFDQIPFLSRFKLYFTAGTFFQNNTFIELFPSMLGSITEDTLIEAINVMTILLLKTTYFYIPHIVSFMEFITNVILNGSDPAKVKAMFLLDRIAESQEAMARQTPEFYEPTITSLITIMATIPEDAPLIENPDSMEPYVVATQVFERVSQLAMYLDGTVFFFKLLITELQKQNEWNVYYAVITAASRASSIDIARAGNDINSVISIFIELLRTPEKMDRIQLALYQAIDNFILRMLIQDTETATLIFEFLVESYSSETLVETIQAALKCLRDLLDSLIVKAVISAHPDFLGHLLQELVDCDDINFLHYFVDLLGSTCKVTTNLEENIEQIVEVFGALSEVSDINTQVSTIIAFTKFASKLDPCQRTAGFEEELELFFDAACELVFSEECPPLDSQSLERCLEELIPLLGTKLADFISEVLPAALEQLQHPIDFQLYTAFEEIPLSGVVSAPLVDNPSQKNFMDQNDYFTYDSNLKLVYLCIAAMGADLVSEFPTFLQLCESYLSANYFIPEFRITAWTILSAMCDFVDQSDSKIFCDKMLELYILQTETNNATYMNHMYGQIYHCFRTFMKKEFPLDNKYIQVLMEPLPKIVFVYANYIFKYKRDNMTWQIHAEEVGEEIPAEVKQDELLNGLAKDGADAEDIFSSVALMIKLCGKINPHVMDDIFRQKLQPQLAMMTKGSVFPYIGTYSLKVMFEYFLVMHSVTEVSSKSFFAHISHVLTASDWNMAEAVFTFLARFALKNELPPEAVIRFFTMINEFCNSEAITNNNVYITAENLASVLASILILRNRPIFDNEEIIPTWMDILETSENVRYQKYHIILFTLFLQEGHQWLLSPDDIDTVVTKIAKCTTIYCSDEIFAEFANSIVAFYSGTEVQQEFLQELSSQKVRQDRIEYILSLFQ